MKAPKMTNIGVMGTPTSRACEEQRSLTMYDTTKSHNYSIYYR